MPRTADDILRFWFADSLAADTTLESHERRWFQGDKALDLAIARHFGADLECAGRGELDHWAHTAHGRLALIILLDQFPRNAFRGRPKAYAFDARAATLCHEGIAANADRGLAPIEQLFFTLPLLHSERLSDQRQSVERFKHLLARAPRHQRRYFAAWLGLARRHRAVIRLFGRFPHRNGIIGRQSTGAERAFLTLSIARAGAARGLRRLRASLLGRLS
ncbi:MAG: DUF924 family protein [Acetobacteraceae bacterium]